MVHRYNLWAMDNKPTEQTENFYFALFVVRISTRLKFEKITTWKQYKKAIETQPIFEGSTFNNQQIDFLKYYYIFITTNKPVKKNA